MKANIERGSGFKGLLSYVLDEGMKSTEIKKPEIVGGNMDGNTSELLSAEFSATRKLRPDIQKPVWHCSLSLPKNERLDSKKWDEIGRSFLEKMKLDPDSHQYVLVRHNDTDFDHIHIVATRISLDSQVWHGKFEMFNAIKATQKLEKEFGLEITAGLFEIDKFGNEVKKVKDKKNLSFNEVQQSARTGEVPVRAALQNIIDEALDDEQDVFSFIERIESAGAIALPNVAKTGKMNGFSFHFNGINFKGSDLGKNYTWKNIQERGVKYEQNGQSKRLIESAKRIKQGINTINDREPEVVARRTTKPSRSGKQNININDSIDSRASTISRISNEEHRNISAISTKSDTKFNERSEHNSKITETSNKSSEKSDNKTSTQNLDVSNSNRNDPWSDIIYNLTELSAPLNKSSASNKVNFEAWNTQHKSLCSPLYRITLISRGGAKPWNMGKKGDDEYFFTAQEVANKIPELRRKNAEGRDIYITPIDSKHHYIVVDDLTSITRKAFDESGYKPCLIQESSKDNQQAIIKIKKSNDDNEQQSANEIVKDINSKFGDKKFSGVIHPFRMAGFSNKKEGRNNALTVIISAVHQLCEKTESLLNKVKDSYKKKKVESKIKARIQDINNESISDNVTDATSAFRRHFKKILGLAKSKNWTVDNSRIDFNVCKDMFKEGFSELEIKMALISASPEILQRKNDVDDYADRTVSRAKTDIKKKILERKDLENNSPNDSPKY